MTINTILQISAISYTVSERCSFARRGMEQSLLAVLSKKKLIEINLYY